MNYSLLDAFLVWLGPLCLVGLILAFVIVLVVACILLDKWNVPNSIQPDSEDGFANLPPETLESYNAYLKEVRRLESIRLRSQKAKLKKTNS